MATQETWKKRISAWRSSGRSAEDFAIGRGFTAAALQDAARRAEPEVRLARVELVAERVPDEVYRLAFVPGTRPTLIAGFCS
jgi:hypothetical protein